MTRLQHLLIKLAEECNELSKAAQKSALFGLDKGHPNGTTSNEDDMQREFNDILALISMLKDDNYLEKIHENKKLIEIKKEKVEFYIKYAMDIGSINENTKKNIINK